MGVRCLQRPLALMPSAQYFLTLLSLEHLDFMWARGRQLDAGYCNGCRMIRAVFIRLYF